MVALFTRMGFVVVAVGLALACGCKGSKTRLVAVRGSVLYKDAPAAGAVVVFHPVGDNSVSAIRPRGMVGSDGTFLLTSLTSDDGAPPGEYNVAIYWPAESKAAKSGREAENPATDRLNDRYNNAATSGFKATVGPDATQLAPFVLK